MNLKPVIFVQGKYGYNAENTTQQIMLLKALRLTQDPKKLVLNSFLFSVKQFFCVSYIQREASAGSNRCFYYVSFLSEQIILTIYVVNHVINKPCIIHFLLFGES